VIEFFLEDYSLDYIFYFKQIFELNFGGLMDNPIQCISIPMKVISNYIEIITISCEVIIVILLLSQFFSLTRKIYIKSEAYSKWLRETFEALSNKNTQVRESNNPEFIRKIIYIFDFYIILELIFLSISVY